MVKVGIKVSPVSTIWIGTILWDPFSDFCEGLESIRGIMSSRGAEIDLNLQDLYSKGFEFEGFYFEGFLFAGLEFEGF